MKRLAAFFTFVAYCLSSHGGVLSTLIGEQPKSPVDTIEVGRKSISDEKDQPPKEQPLKEQLTIAPDDKSRQADHEIDELTRMDESKAKSSLETMRKKFSLSISKGIRANKNDCNSMTIPSSDYSNAIDECRRMASTQNTNGLRNGSIKPNGCFELADQMNSVDTIFKVDAMHVSVAQKMPHGIFHGVVQSITKQEILIQDSKTRISAYVTTSDRSKIFNPSEIYVGANLYGFGEQTSSRQVLLTDGSQSTVAVIHAKCISPPNDLLNALGL